MIIVPTLGNHLKTRDNFPLFHHIRPFYRTSAAPFFSTQTAEKVGSRSGSGARKFTRVWSLFASHDVLQEMAKGTQETAKGDGAEWWLDSSLLSLFFFPFLTNPQEKWEGFCEILRGWLAAFSKARVPFRVKNIINIPWTFQFPGCVEWRLSTLLKPGLLFSFVFFSSSSSSKSGT